MEKNKKTFKRDEGVPVQMFKENKEQFRTSKKPKMQFPSTQPLPIKTNKHSYETTQHLYELSKLPKTKKAQTNSSPLTLQESDQHQRKKVINENTQSRVLNAKGGPTQLNSANIQISDQLTEIKSLFVNVNNRLDMMDESIQAIKLNSTELSNKIREREEEKKLQPHETKEFKALAFKYNINLDEIELEHNNISILNASSYDSGSNSYARDLARLLFTPEELSRGTYDDGTSKKTKYKKLDLNRCLKIKACVFIKCNGKGFEKIWKSCRFSLKQMSNESRADGKRTKKQEFSDSEEDGNNASMRRKNPFVLNEAIESRKTREEFEDDYEDEDEYEDDGFVVDDDENSIIDMSRFKRAEKPSFYHTYNQTMSSISSIKLNNNEDSD